MFRSILVGIDDGPHSDHPVAMALELSRAFRARLEFVRAVPVEPPRWQRMDEAQRAALRAERLGQAWQSSAQELGRRLTECGSPELRAEELLRVVPGLPGRALVAEAVAARADLVVIGAHQPRRFIDFGGATRALLAQCPCPVWMQSVPPAPIRRILVPVDLSETTAACLAVAREIARGLGAEVEVLHANEPLGFAPLVPAELGGIPDAVPFPEAELRAARMEALERAVAAIAWGDVPLTTVFQDSPPAELILARHEDADLVVLGTHGASAFVRALIGGVAHAVAAHAVRPVLAVPTGSHLGLPSPTASTEELTCSSPS